MAVRLPAPGEADDVEKAFAPRAALGPAIAWFKDLYRDMCKCLKDGKTHTARLACIQRSS